MLFRPTAINKLSPAFTLAQRFQGTLPFYRYTRRRSTAALLSAVSNEGSGTGTILGVNNERPTTTATTEKIDPSEPDNMGLYRLLTSQERELLAEQRRLTETCKQVATQVLGGRTEENKTIFSQLEPNFLNLESSFSVVIAGEFNAGKSTLINALLGQKLLESGSLPTTDCITIVASSDHADTTALPLGVIWHAVPDVPILTDLTIIDTPGTNSTWLDHTERTLRLLPAADLILFVTSADRPFSESERDLLKGIQAYRKSIVVVLNKTDILEADGGDHGKEAKQAVVDFVIERSSELLGARPIVIPLSARDALSAKLMGKQNDVQRSNVWLRSQFEELESFLKDSLTTEAKLKSKLANPIGVVEGVLIECSKVLDGQSEELQSDIATLNVLRAQFEGWKKELAADLQGFQQGTTAVVRSQGERWHILLNRMNFFSFHYNVLADRAKFDQEWDETRIITSIHHQKGLKSDILSQVDEIA
jgi:small GTP-binding protein